MRKSTRIIAAGLALSMTVPVLTACKKGRGGEKIASDTPWYNLTVAQIDDGLDADNVDYGYSNFIGVHGDNFVFRKGGSYKLPDGFDYDNDDRTPYNIDEINVYDINGDLINTVNLNDVTASFTGYDYVGISNIRESGNTYMADVECDVFSTGAVDNFNIYIDVDNGTVSDPVPMANDGLIDNLVANGGSNERTVDVGDYKVTEVWFSGDVTNYVLVVEDANGNTGTIELRNADSLASVYNIQGIVDVGNNKAVVIATLSGGEAAFYEINLQALTASKINEDMSWLASHVSSITTVSGLGTVVSENEGLYTINYDNRSIDPLFLYEYANVNAYEVGRFTPIMVSESRAIFSGTLYNPYPATSNTVKTVFYIFDRADSNPNAGKTILDVASVNTMSYPLACAICSFNETNPDYYMRLDMSYQIPSTVQYATGENADQDLETAANNLGNQLAIDIMSGTGPDIIINGTQFGMLNNDDYLLNLSDFAATNLGSDKYYTNVFEAAKINGNLYQIPVSFGVQGLAADASGVNDGQIGFTFDQYAAFVQGPCNGHDPINRGRLYFFINCLNCMSDLMVENGAVNYDNEAFRSLAEFTASNINEVLQGEDEEEYYMDEGAAYVANVLNVGYYFNVTSSGKVLVGMPSYDGRGPAITVHDSVGISAQTIAPDACKEFVSLLLGDQIQEYYGAQDGVCVNRSAFATVGDKYIGIHNDEVDANLRRFSEAEARSYGMSVDYYDESFVTSFEQLVESLDCMYINDGSVNAILREEVPAYLEGQKTLEQIIPVLNDRIQTVINERR